MQFSRAFCMYFIMLIILNFLIFKIHSDVLHGKVSCQFDEPQEDDEDESEYDIAILESAGEILPKFGKAMSAQEFYAYFGRVSQFLATKIVNPLNCFRNISNTFNYFF